MSLSKSLIKCFFLILMTAAHCAMAQESDATDQIPSDAEVIKKGKSIFSGNCKQCHNIHNKVVGPMLAGVYERQSVPWLINFIKYPEKVIKSGDEYAVALYEQYKPQLMPNHDFFSDEEVLSIIAYIKDETIKGPPNATAASVETTALSTNPAEEANTTLLQAIIVGLVILLMLLLAVVILMLSVLSRYLSQKEGLSEQDKAYVGQTFSFSSVLKSAYFINIVTFIFIVLASKTIVDGLFSIGVQQGYAPEQPIKFSHKLHAGYYEIDCQYCHTGVEKSKSANIPSANICMNCHNAIKTTSPEIQKIYVALEKDEPIQWVRVHNLPDLAYFNHSQHVKVGGLECENCHGNIKEMEVVQQISLLTMGWCIDCHRQTKVNAKDNAYYDKLVLLHEAKNTKEPLKVENIGGLECARCHY